MIILIAGSSHTGKTLLAQRLLEKYQYPYLSIDHLKMGLIRSGQTSLTVYDDELLTKYLWAIVKEIIKTNIENHQNLIVEGCYIPFDYKDYFNDEYLQQIEYICLIFTDNYINNHYDDILKYGSVIENRFNNECPKSVLLEENRSNLLKCKINDCKYILIDDTYNINLDF